MNNGNTIRNRKQSSTSSMASSPGEKGQGSRSTWTAIVAVLALGLLMVWRSRPAPVEVPAKTQAPEAPRIIESNKQLKQMQSAGQKRTELLIAERAAGLQALPLQQRAGQGPVLKVQVKSFSRGCGLGDWDIIRQDLKWLENKNAALVLSLEEIGETSIRRLKQKTVTVDELRKGFRTEFVLDQVKDRRVMGLFLCSTHGRACQTQSRPSLSELSQLQMQIRSGDKNPNQYPQDDKIFFFHMLVAYPDRLLLHDSGQTLDKSQVRLQAALDKGGDAVSPLLLKDLMQRVRTTGSLPGIVMNDYLQIQMPHKDDKCF